MKVLVVIDMQNDFINGALGTKEAEAVVPKAAEKIKAFSGKVFYTRDTHEKNYLETQEGKKLPVPHCIQGSSGWELNPEIEKLRDTEPVDKPSFGSLELGYAIKDYELKQAVTGEDMLESITLIGLCTDICVISNAMILKAMFPEVQIVVDASCCAGVTQESHKNALEAMKMCQIEIENEV